MTLSVADGDQDSEAIAPSTPYVQLLPGWTARAWLLFFGRIWYSWLSAMLVALPVMFVLGPNHPLYSSVGPWYCLAVFVAAPVVAVISWRRLRAASQREARAGYTTRTDIYFELPRVDPDTGRVIRLAGHTELIEEGGPRG